MPKEHLTPVNAKLVNFSIEDDGVWKRGAWAVTPNRPEWFQVLLAPWWDATVIISPKHAKHVVFEQAKVQGPTDEVTQRYGFRIQLGQPTTEETMNFLWTLWETWPKR